MTRILIAIFLLLSVLSCSSSQDVEIPIQDTDVSVNLRFCKTVMPLITRTSSDSEIAGGSLRMALHNSLFVTGGSFEGNSCELNCPPGKYRVYASANVPETAYVMVSALDTLSVPCVTTQSVLPMSWKGEVEIPSGVESYNVPEISLTRAMARISVNIRVSDKAPGIELRKVSYCSLPKRTFLFAPSSPSARYDATPISVSSKSFSDIFYMGENLSGVVPEITSQRGKNSEVAPDGSSYILIHAQSGNRVLAYRVYLGANNTSDFNVRRNTEYRLQITLCGEDSIDTRLNSYTLDISDTVEEGMIGSWSTQCPSSLNVGICDGEGLQFELCTECLKGESEFFTVASAHCPLRIEAHNGDNTYDLSYSPPMFTSHNSELEYRVFLTDSQGYESERIFSHRFANRVEVYCTLPSESVVGGSIEFSNVLAYNVKGEMNNIYQAAVLDLPFTVSAIPSSGYSFGGWYADSERKVKISSSPVLELTAHSATERIFALFTYTSDRIYYITSDEKTINPYGDAFGQCNIVDNFYENGRGTIVFDGDVYEIGDSAFQNCTTLCGITLPQTISLLGRYAFRGCNSLCSLSVPPVVDAINDGVFSGCTSLVSVTFSNAVKSIGDSAFYYCSNLQRVDLRSVGYIGDSAFCRCSSLKDTGLESAISIGDWAFAYCTTLDSLSAPKVQTVGLFAFQSCTGLKRAELSEKVERIGSGAFACCDSLHTVRIYAAKPPSIIPHTSSTHLFESCPMLERIEVRSSSIEAYRIAWDAYSSIIVPIE